MSVLAGKVAEQLKASDSKMKNALSQICSLVLRPAVIGISHFPFHQPSAEIR
jgi:hypothetical protein